MKSADAGLGECPCQKLRGGSRGCSSDESRVEFLARGWMMDVSIVVVVRAQEIVGRPA